MMVRIGCSGLNIKFSIITTEANIANEEIGINNVDCVTKTSSE